MENPEFFISRNKLEYNIAGIAGQKALDYSDEEYGPCEVVSVFYLNLKYEDEIYIPVALFQNKLTPLQIIVKYLKENLSKTNKQIALLLNRDPKTTWITYKSVKKKKPLLAKEAGIQIPLSIFRNRKLSTLEALVRFLKNLDIKYSEIARLLNKDQRTIWTVYSRAKKKLGKDKKNEYK